MANRSYNSNIPGFSSPTSVAFDAAGNVWVSDDGRTVPHQRNAGDNGVYKYNSFPSQTLIEVPNTFEALGGYILDLDVAVDQSTGEVFVSQSNGRTVQIFAPESPTHRCERGETVCYSHSWTSINGTSNGAAASAGIHIAIDNSNSFSRGRIYLTLTEPEDNVEVFDSGERPVDFPATAKYIKANKLVGTPRGHFGQVQDITVDSVGNIYVTDIGKSEVDEFASTGVYLRSFPAPRSGGQYGGPGGVGVDPTTGNILITESAYNEENGEGGIREFDSSGNFLEALKGDAPQLEGFQPEGVPAVSGTGFLYVPVSFRRIDIFGPAGVVPKVAYGPVSEATATSGTLNATVDPNGGGNVTECQFEYVPSAEFKPGTAHPYGTGPAAPCLQSTPYMSETNVSAALASLVTDTTYHYRVVVHNANGVKYGEDETYTPHKVVGLSTGAASEITESSATLNASFVGNGEETHYHFEWGLTEAYGHEAGAGSSAPGSGSTAAVSTALSKLNPFTTYHYRVSATDGVGTSIGEDMTFTTPPGTPTVIGESTSEVHSDRAVLHAQVNPNGAATSVHFEYVTDADFRMNGFENATSTAPEVSIGMNRVTQVVEPQRISGIVPGTVYHYRAVATNEAGVGIAGSDHTFTTFPFERELNDHCPNAHVRQQTGSSLLLDCRAYELVSSANSGGYDVESTLVGGQTPFGGYPEAESPAQVLYGVHDGGIPGTGNSTNRGVDPYVATRGKSGWTTKYVGIPASDPYAKEPFSSTLSEANASLETFAFGGENICSPCFKDGSTGMPMHLPSGELVQGMVGSIAQPAAKPAGFINKHLSADGSHFVFGSKSKFEPDANEGEVSIYDRNLATEETHVVSKTPAGQTMKEEGNEIGELDISKDGSRIVVGKLVSEEGGAEYWHLYMNIGDSSKTIDLTPGAADGVLYDGMTADGSKVFFTTKDRLLPEDTDNSADIYEAEVEPEGNLTLHLISTGTEGTGNSNSCDPSANTKHEHWNTTGSEENCGVVAIGGGGGVASGNGTIYFLSPERLDGSSNGVQNAPNLYVARPGQPPHFVATLESNSNSSLPPHEHPFIRSFGIFENPAGVAIDNSDGDVYVLDLGAGGVLKFDSSGHPLSGFGVEGKLETSTIGFYNVPTGIAVDNDPSSPSYGDLYVPELGSVKKYSPSGAYLATIPGGGVSMGVAVDPANGNVYVADGLFGPAQVEVFDAHGSYITSFGVAEFSPSPTALAVDSSGTVYVVNGGGFANAKGTTEEYTSTGTHIKTLDENPSYGVAVDPSNQHVYVDEGTQVSEFNPTGEEEGSPVGSGVLSLSVGVAADAGSLDVSNRGRTDVASFGPPITPPDEETDNPLVIDSVDSPGARDTADFQVTPSGNDVAFTSTLPLTNYDTGLIHREVYRYDAVKGLECASCNQTHEQATGRGALPSNGLGISNDGRVFFDSTEGLVDRDLNGKEDAYEWEPMGFELGHEQPPCETAAGCVGLISTGASPNAAKLLGVSSSGTDAYFFTREKLTEQDENGNTVKIYDARSLGGFPYSPPLTQCKAADECHGPGSAVPPPPNIKSKASTPGGNSIGAKCKTGYLKKRGKCIRKPKIGHHHKRRSHRGGPHHHG